MNLVLLNQLLGEGYVKSAEHLDIVDSTNTYAANAEVGTLIIADCQTGGRGRSGKSFMSPIGGIYFSFVTDMFEDNPLMSTTIAAVAVSQTIAEVCSLQNQIKWVNDIYIDGKKVAGILTEKKPGKVIVGVGINYIKQDFGEELSSVAGFLFDNNLSVSKEEIIASIINKMEALDVADPKSYMPYYRANSFVLKKVINFIENGVEHTGFVSDITDSANLVVDADDGRHILNSGEVVLTKFQ